MLVCSQNYSLLTLSILFTKTTKQKTPFSQSKTFLLNLHQLYQHTNKNNAESVQCTQRMHKKHAHKTQILRALIMIKNNQIHLSSCNSREDVPALSSSISISCCFFKEAILLLWASSREVMWFWASSRYCTAWLSSTYKHTTH